MTFEEIINLYEQKFGKVETKSGYRLDVSKSAKGNFSCRKYYQRSSWVDSELESVVVFNDKGEVIVKPKHLKEVAQ